MRDSGHAWLAVVCVLLIRFIIFVVLQDISNGVEGGVSDAAFRDQMDVWGRSRPPPASGILPANFQILTWPPMCLMCLLSSLAICCPCDLLHTRLCEGHHAVANESAELCLVCRGGRDLRGMYHRLRGQMWLLLTTNASHLLTLLCVMLRYALRLCSCFQISCTSPT